MCRSKPWRRLTACAIKSGAITAIDVEHEGRIFWFVIVPICAEGYCNWYGRDVTAQRQAEQQMRSLSERYQALLAAVPDIIAEVDRNKVYTWANAAAHAFFGEDMIGREASFYFAGEQDTYEIVQPLFAGTAENTIFVESWQRRRDGQKRLLAWWCRTLKDSKGNVAGALSTARDITEQREAQTRILENEQRFRQAMDATNAGLWYWDISTGRTYYSPTYLQMLGYGPGELPDMNGAWVDSHTPG